MRIDSKMKNSSSLNLYALHYCQSKYSDLRSFENYKLSDTKQPSMKCREYCTKYFYSHTGLIVRIVNTGSYSKSESSSLKYK